MGNLARAGQLRLALWGGAGLLLLVPLVAMQLGTGVDWSAGDFLFAATMLGGAGAAFEIGIRAGRSWRYRAGLALALFGAVTLVWACGAVGLLGSEGNPANLLYLGVIGIGLGGAIGARLEPAGMARAMIATAVALIAVGVLAIPAGWGGGSPVVEILGLNAGFAALFAGAAAFFRRS
ncbi:hypothetical protein [Pseudoroseicyclus sp. CXY001]|uniref:hypothetical protein n=1 Tax=Pseudoroseicyclus sp. CXY001 TaxID=3242492 RepID=UPI00357095FB